MPAAGRVAILRWVACTMAMGSQADTSPRAQQAQLDVYRARPAPERLEMGLALSDQVREVCVAGIRARHPKYTEAQARQAMWVLTLGEALYRQAWPARPILDP